MVSTCTCTIDMTNISMGLGSGPEDCFSHGGTADVSQAHEKYGFGGRRWDALILWLAVGVGRGAHCGWKSSLANGLLVRRCLESSDGWTGTVGSGVRWCYMPTKWYDLEWAWCGCFTRHSRSQKLRVAWRLWADGGSRPAWRGGLQARDCGRPCLFTIESWSNFIPFEPGRQRTTIQM